MFAEHTERGFELIEPGSVEQVEQAVHLGKMAVQTACEFGLRSCGREHFKEQRGIVQNAFADRR